ncbi:uncharacterized protein EAE98_000627 [Botrytis deweyae]|uniref:Uncharacterized protein n=1 Tax=Botrytis deweyae TaxID=2478750 RepID=A0ABQ7J385_9HELO|nr:uncharacterized protein EAE98_000627 [Botrytis deweyae]KAF7940500.1 hypothetical protein EAE98_000627 [Botrytis deweyae]
MTSRFPLGKVTTAHLQKLTEVLWSWYICTDCLAGKPCNSADCLWSRSIVLGPYFEFFKISTCNYTSNIASNQTPALVSYEELFKIMRELKSNPELPKADLLEKLFTDRPTRVDQERALNLAVRVVMMISCSASRQSSVLLEYGNQQARWDKNDTFSQFLNDAFPKVVHPSIDEIKKNLQATKLKKHARLNFRPTDDLRNHLRLDRNAGTVEIFHHTAFLKEQLRLTKEQPQNLSISDLIKIGALPRPLVIDVLDSIQEVLFPLAETKSRELLISLTSTYNFDGDILRYDGVSVRKPNEIAQYQYFGKRLADLYNELLNPTPRGFERWFERKSSARFMMMVTLSGVVLAIFLGLLSLALGGFQAYVGYMAWKNPVQISSGSQKN